MSVSAEFRKTEAPATHADLMREMGSPNGFNPMPPSQHLSFLDVREPEETRVVAWVWSKTIHPDKRRRRWARAHDERGDLTVKHLAADLGMAPSNTSDAVKRAAQKGRIRIDERGRFFLCGNVPEPRRTNGEAKDEENIKVICTDNLPAQLALYFEQLDENRRAQCEHDYFAIREYRKVLERDAMAAARDAGQTIEDDYLRAIGYEDQERRGRPKAERTEAAVQLSLLRVPELSVQINGNGQAWNSVQNGNGYLYKTQNEAVQISASLLPSEVQRLQSEVESAPVENHAPAGSEGDQLRCPPPTPLKTEKVAAARQLTPDPKTPEREKSNPEAEVIEAVEGLLGHALGKDPIKAKFGALPGTFAIPAKSVRRFLHEKWLEKQAKRYSIHNAGAFYKIAIADLPGWIRTHRREIANDRQLLERSPAPLGINERIEVWENLLREVPEHPEAPQWRERLAELRAERTDQQAFDPATYNAELQALAAKKGLS